MSPLYTVTIDDAASESEAHGIRFYGEWNTSAPSPGALNNTIHRAHAGAYAVVRFMGTSVTVYGTVPPWDAVNGPASSMYVIDGGHNTAGNNWTGEWALYCAPNVSDGHSLQRHIFYQSPPLVEGSHQLNVSYQSGGDFLLDYITFTTTRPPPNANHSPRAAVIVGALLSGLAIVSLAALALCYWRRYRVRRVQEDPSMKDGLLYSPPPIVQQEFPPSYRARDFTITPFANVTPYVPPTTVVRRDKPESLSIFQRPNASSSYESRVVSSSSGHSFESQLDLDLYVQRASTSAESLEVNLPQEFTVGSDVPMSLRAGNGPSQKAERSYPQTISHRPPHQHQDAGIRITPVSRAGTGLTSATAGSVPPAYGEY
ncbi:hypothetical protein PUNSTDRAFT_143839 [Punctularia strigosozonata HHB-11173 SS5]|uniref:uncharacterized protein n=1 Tax=Punctularia strigosozonata (strain HHB-11173) TaxID=741275 RepID=UPI0004418381|nr:uncharacterized protein PUNSTDRAFT_143839 [Punctularia strigosozonata HHB-11173 SS5]EIN08163.1 hypothetical protein PUNSTDRAFT_143839 [Punctularia strigosozonata HHB-11173 SS5]